MVCVPNNKSRTKLCWYVYTGSKNKVLRPCEFVGIRSGAREVSILVRYCAAFVDDWWTFVSPSSNADCPLNVKQSRWIRWIGWVLRVIGWQKR